MIVCLDMLIYSVENYNNIWRSIIKIRSAAVKADTFSEKICEIN